MKGIKRDLNNSIKFLTKHMDTAGNAYAEGYLQALTDVKMALNGESAGITGKYWVKHGEMQSEIAELKRVIAESDNIVFFGGAGVSTESGIPDFRSVDGLYSEQYDHPPEEILSASFFRYKPAEFYKFYKNKMLPQGIKPNLAHKTLAELERKGKLKAIITQNIDSLHQSAGSKNVIELHGSSKRNFCTECGAKYDIDALKRLLSQSDIPTCTCGGIIKPDVVLYEEQLNQDLLARAVNYITEADVLIIGGTSLSVFPAASLILYFGGSHLILINKSETSYDKRASLVIRTGIGYALSESV